MGRPKRYATHAEQQAAYRQRRDADMITVNRASLTAWEQRVTRVCAAIALAAHAGDPLACALRGTHDAETLERLAAWFNERGKEEIVQ